MNTTLAVHSDGTSPQETLAVIIPTFIYATITSITVSTFKTGLFVRFCYEILLLVVPIILNFTVLANQTFELLVYSFLLLITLVLLLNFNSKSTKHPPKETVTVSLSYITNARATINILSVLAILAVDFRIFPRRYAKTVSYGYSLMDVGVGLYIYSNGIVDNAQIKSLYKSLKGCIPLLVLGVGRFVVTRQTDYHVPVSEYGLHWNFFITLLVVKLFVSLLFARISVHYIWINACLLMISYEILLEMGLKDYVLKETRRDTFVSSNREGIVSSLGYVCLYLFSTYFSHLLNLKKGTDSIGTALLKFIILCLVTLSISIISEDNFGISRKLANTAYCFWVLFIGIFMTGLYYVADKYLQRLFGARQYLTPYIFEAINYNGLAFFLLGNLLTGLVNLSIVTLKMGTLTSLTILLVYMAVNCGLMCILHKRNIKIKL